MNIGNLESPPDTAFLLELIIAGAHLIVKESAQDLSNVSSTIKQFLLSAGDALSVGGVHTPNHRWVVSAALARLNALYPNKKYLDRIDDWLGEGVSSIVTATFRKEAEFILMLRIMRYSRWVGY